MPGWIALHRDIRDHWIYAEKRVFSQYEAWTSILMRVNHKEGKVMHNGTLETVERGSTIWSLGDMEKEWGWSNTKVKRFLKRLQDEEMLTFKSTTKKTYVTVVKYDEYQFVSDEKTPPKHQENATETPPEHTNNNVNTENTVKKKNKKHMSDENFEKFWDTYPRHIGKADAIKAWSALLNRGKDPEQVINAAYNYFAIVSAQGTEEKFIKHPSSFLNSDRWEEFLSTSISTVNPKYSNGGEKNEKGRIQLGGNQTASRANEEPGPLTQRAMQRQREKYESLTPEELAKLEDLSDLPC